MSRFFVPATLQAVTALDVMATKILATCFGEYSPSWRPENTDTCYSTWIIRADLGVSPGPPPPPFVVYLIFQNYMFKMESRHLLDLCVQNALDCISENFNLKNFQGGACTRTSLEKCPARHPDGRYCAHNATVYYISRSPLSQNPLSIPGGGCQMVSKGKI